MRAGTGDLHLGVHRPRPVGPRRHADILSFCYVYRIDRICEWPIRIENEEHALAAARDFAEKLAIEAADRDRERRFAADELAQLSETGLLAITVPEAARRRRRLDGNGDRGVPAARHG